MLTLQDRLLLAELEYDPEQIKQRLPGQMLRDFNSPLKFLEEVEYAVTGLKCVQMRTPTSFTSSTPTPLTILTARHDEEILSPEEWRKRRHKQGKRRLDEKEEYSSKMYHLHALSVVNEHDSFWYTNGMSVNSRTPFELKRNTYTDGDGDVHDNIRLHGSQETVLEVFGRKIAPIRCAGELFTPNPHPIRLYRLPNKGEYENNIFWRELAKQSGAMMVDTEGRVGGKEVLFECPQGSVMIESFLGGGYPTTIQSSQYFDTLVQHFRKQRLFYSASRSKSRIETRIPEYQGYRFLPILKLLNETVEVEQ